MTDNHTTVAELKALQSRFVEERDWEQFHSPHNLAMALMVEAGELLELFLWTHTHPDRPGRRPPDPQKVRHEVADVAICLLNFCRMSDIDLAAAIAEKTTVNATKYPAETVRGSAEKYDEIRARSGVTEG